jgi:exosortase
MPLPVRRIALSLAPFAAFCWLYSGVLLDLADEWDPDADRAHGIFIIPIAVYLAWRRRDHLPAGPVPASPVIGGAVLSFGLCLLTVGTVASQFLARVSILPTIAGMILILYGRRHLRVLAFPVGFLALMIPPPGLLYNVPVFNMQLAASNIAEAIVRLGAIPVLREGNVMVLPATTLEVVAACSGVRSLMTLVSIAVLYGHLTDTRVWIRCALVAATVPIAVLANGIRVGGTAVLMHHWGPQAALGFFHVFSGIVVFVITLATLALIHDLLLRTVHRHGTRPATAS